LKLQGREIPQEIWDGLRTCQQESIKTAFSYLNRPTPEKSCLISLPTGAGKTGVISVVSHFWKTNKTILVLCHRRAVGDQLIRQMKGTFFNKIAPDLDVQLKPVDGDLTDVSKPGIYVSLFQKLTKMTEEDLQVLKENIDILIIDEGHSEPSPVWSKLARDIEAHKIVITATPYRNDLFKFDVEPDWSLIYTFNQALSSDIVCDPTFNQIAKTNIVATIKNHQANQSDLVCIVKCNGANNVREFYDLLSSEFKTLAVHNCFKDSITETQKFNVPKNVASEGWEVLIHENKLDEGVDIPQAKMIVLTYSISNGRELVQTIGRVVRKYDDKQPFVYELESDSNERMWRNFRGFDEFLSNSESAKHFLKSLDTAGLLESYMGAFPKYSYFDSEFKRKFDLDEFDPQDSLVIPLASVCFVKKTSSFALNVMMNTLDWRFSRAGELTKLINNCCGFEVLVSISFKNSRYLKNELFFQPSFEVFLVKELEDYVAIFDSRSRSYSGEKELGLGSAVNTDKLLSLASTDVKTRTKEAHTTSITEGDKTAAGVSLRGRELEQTNASQSNSTYACTTLKIDNVTDDDKVSSSYYLGLGNGRVADQKKRNFSLPELNEWIDESYETINANLTNASPFLNSFAKPVDEVPSEDPVSILIDLEERLEITCDGVVLVLEEGFIYKDYEDGVDFLGTGPKVTIEYCHESEQLMFVSDVSINCIDSEGGVVDGGLTGALNKSKLVALYKSGLTYSNGKFYRVVLPSQSGMEIEETGIGQAMYGLTDLQVANLEEKDESSVLSDSFSQDSLFNIIDQLKNVADPAALGTSYGPFHNHISDVDLLFCSDMGPEPADFIISSPTKLAYVHVKCGDANTPQSSAGALAEVGGQAIKNIEHLISHNLNFRPGNMGNLKTHWPRINSDPFLQERVRLFQRGRFTNAQDDQQVREDKLAEVLGEIAQRRRSRIVKKEIWIVVGRAFSKDHFITQMRRGSTASPTSLQAYQLLDSWMATAAGLGVEMKFFVSP
jgi:superfamily II DNA or RNA helicase